MEYNNKKDKRMGYGFENRMVVFFRAERRGKVAWYLNSGFLPLREDEKLYGLKS